MPPLGTARPCRRRRLAAAMTGPPVGAACSRNDRPACGSGLQPQWPARLWERLAAAMAEAADFGCGAYPFNRNASLRRSACPAFRKRLGGFRHRGAGVLVAPPSPGDAPRSSAQPISGTSRSAPKALFRQDAKGAKKQTFSSLRPLRPLRPLRCSACSAFRKRRGCFRH